MPHLNALPLPQGNKSVVTLARGGTAIHKAYNDNGCPHGKYEREVGFYRHYQDSPLIPALLECLPHEPAIVIARAPGVLCSTLQVSPKQRRHLSADYAEKVADLVGFPAKTRPEASPFAAGGAAEYRDEVVSVLEGYPTESQQAERILGQLRDAARGIAVTCELLIKLDWNSSNVFASRGAITQFIDFEQAFVGTSEMLTGILLYNPFWHAGSVFNVLSRRGYFRFPPAEVSRCIRFALAAVLADSYDRTHRPWDSSRIEFAYQRHVTDRLTELHEMHA